MEKILEINLEKSEYEIQHFNFSAASVTYERKQLMRDVLLAFLNKTACKLTDKENLLEALKSQSDAIANSVFADITPELELLQKLDERNFSIAPHVLLPNDFGHAKENCTEADNKELDDKLEELQKNFLDKTLMCACLEMENSDYDAIEPLVKEEEKVQNILLSANLLKEIENVIRLSEKISDKTSKMRDSHYDAIEPQEKELDEEKVHNAILRAQLLDELEIVINQSNKLTL